MTPEVHRGFPSLFSIFIFSFSFLSLTPDRILTALFNPSFEFCGSGSLYLEPAFHNTTYLDSIRWTPPGDTTLNIPPFGPIVTSFDSFQVIGVTGLPPGISYQCDDPNCSWSNMQPNPNLNIIRLIGNPGFATSGKYVVKVEVRYFITLLGNPSSFTNTDSSLFIYLCPFQGTSNSLEIKQLDQNLININLSSGSSTGYYFGTDFFSITHIISSPNEIFLLSENQILFSNFQINSGAIMVSGTCPE